MDICSNFSKRPQNEASLIKARVGNVQLGGLDDVGPGQDDIQVERPWLPSTLGASVPAMLGFDFE